jgi:hypothetical protein
MPFEEYRVGRKLFSGNVNFKLMVRAMLIYESGCGRVFYPMKIFKIAILKEDQEHAKNRRCGWYKIHAGLCKPPRVWRPPCLSKLKFWIYWRCVGIKDDL